MPRPIPENILTEQMRQRFESRFTKGPGCWEWLGKGDKDGYGKFCVKRATYRAHRISWILFNGGDPGDLCVLHRCDNPRCVRPDHLFLGTPGDNNADRDAKGRQCKGDRHWTRMYPEREDIGAPKGERNGMYTHPEVRTIGERSATAKITEKQALELIAMSKKPGVSSSMLGRKFGISQGQAWRIANGRRWKHLQP
jgi:hypothetical protein